MADKDWLFRNSGAIIVASKAAGLSDAERNQVSGLAWLQAKHAELMKMPENNAVAEFDKLDRKVQQSLTGLFGNTAYNPEELSFFGQAGKYAKNVLGGISDVLTGYSEQIDRPWRALMTMDDVGSFSKAWDQAADGKRMFDANREAQVDKFYGPTVSNIAKRISMGDSIGTIISDLKTDEDFKVMEQLLQGEEFVLRAVRDYDQSKISIGRSFAHLFNLNPDIGAKDQGVESKAYNMLSGITDLAYNVAADPTTWIFAPVQAYRKASLGLVQLTRAQAGDLTTAQKVFGKIAGKQFGFDAAFQKQGVRSAFDAIGEQVKIAANTGVDQMKRSVARQRIQQIMPSLDENAVDQFVKAKVYTADDALNFMKDKEKILTILQGKTGSMTAILPTASARQNFRNSVRNAVQNVTGYNKELERLDNTAFAGSFIDDIAQGQSAASVIETSRMKRFGRWSSRLLENALIERSVYVGGVQNGINMRTKSAGSIYTLARAVFNKADADIIAKTFVSATDEGQARKIVEGLYRTILDSSGIANHEGGQRTIDRLMENWNNQLFSEDAFLSEATAKAGGIASGVYSADSVGGERLANAAYQIKHQVQLPSLVEIQKHVQEYNKFRMTLGIRNLNQSATDLWSALNLLPRLGIRSVLDESLFHALTMPIAVAQNAVRGYQASVTQRVFEGVEGGKNVGVVARHVIRKLMDGVDDATIQAAARDKNLMAGLLETQLTSGIIGKTVFAGEAGKRYAKYVADNVRFNNIEQVRAFSEGMSKAVATGAASSSNMLNSVLELSPELAKAMKADKVRLGGDPAIITKGGAAFLTNAHMQLINRVDRNDAIGKLAVQFMEKPDLAVKKIAKYLKDNPEYYKQFDRYNSKLTNVDSDAFSMYIHVRNMFTNDMDEINSALLSKVRPNGFGKGKGITAANLKTSDIVDVQNGFRNQMFGYGREVQVFQRFGDYVDEILNNGFEVMDRQVATLSREPAFYAYQLHYRDQFAKVEKQYADEWLAKNEFATPELAAEVAAKRFTQLSTDMAMNRVLGFIDNPHVRSNFAFSARNVARYYRANEDFYRRAVRVIREQGPQSVLRMRIANEGLDHFGFIHEDENGDKYFSFFVDEIMYNAYMTVLGPILGVETKRPMPLALSGKIKMLTPSLDPESNLPTFAGPLISVAWSTFKNMPFVPEEWSDKSTRLLFGQYAEGQSFMEALVPSTVKRAWTATSAIADMNNEQVASATMKSMAYYAANGMSPTPQSTMAEREQYMYDVKATARSIVFMRNLLGIFSPVSPQFSNIQDVPPEVLDTGAVPLKQEFQKIVKAEYDKGNLDAWNTALRKWTKLNPGRLVYTVSEAEADTIAPIRKSKEAVNWIKSNGELARKYREAAVFLMPQASEFDLDAYAFLKREGFTKAKDVEKYFEEITNIQAENKYYDIKREYEDLIANTPSPENAAAYRNKMSEELAKVKADNPYLKRKFEQFDGSTQLKLDAVQNMSDALDSGLAPETDTTDRLRRMLMVFNSAYAHLNNITASTDIASYQKDQIRSAAHNELLDIVGADPNAKLFYETIMKRLIG